MVLMEYIVKLDPVCNKTICVHAFSAHRYKAHVALFCGAAIEISRMVEAARVSTSEIYFHTCRVRCLQFLPALSLFALL